MNLECVYVLGFTALAFLVLDINARRSPEASPGRTQRDDVISTNNDPQPPAADEGGAGSSPGRYAALRSPHFLLQFRKSICVSRLQAYDTPARARTCHIPSISETESAADRRVTIGVINSEKPAAANPSPYGILVIFFILEQFLSD
ncbi:hypothetical protein EVAR_34829_1 [Eumeta japonica]|uniref:Uncharacterized protein n=1 Tax=Eumeta variegata TaxID=151549 RepID=A0A4C1WAB7_EUMVA|nr:hypothetical protein EVAR_34829_1 [Eumeta japonica]